MWAVKKADGLWILTINYHSLNKVIPSIASVVLDMITEMQEI